MSRELPAQPNLRNLRNQAKTLLKAHGRGDASVCGTLRLLRRFAEATDAQILGAKVSLTDVQYALAMDYGFASWNRLRAHVEAARNEALAARVAELVRKATELYGSKGPAHDSTGSEWDMALKHLTGEILEAGEAGYLADVELMRSDNARARKEATIHFGIRRDAGSKKQLACLLQDRSHVVRRAALGWYAGAIHPANLRDPIVTISDPADRVPQGVALIVPMVGDPNEKVRMTAVNALAAYRGLGDPPVDGALNRALNDEKHKICHAAAKVLGVVCPGCGTRPK
ncbi:MAG: hypothetical protein JXB04_10990 [Kiritimatiellae bacterium]|nr:hypothetical protein [Kiritimatiellia bacterium]